MIELLLSLTPVDYQHLAKVVSVEAARGTKDEYCVAASVLNRVVSDQYPNTVEEVVLQTGAGSGCGSCKCRIQRLLAGLPAECGPCALCPGCGYVQKQCLCKAA